METSTSTILLHTVLLFDTGALKLHSDSIAFCSQLTTQLLEILFLTFFRSVLGSTTRVIPIYVLENIALQWRSLALAYFTIATQERAQGECIWRSAYTHT